MGDGDGDLVTTGGGISSSLVDGGMEMTESESKPLPGKAEYKLSEVAPKSSRPKPATTMHETDASEPVVVIWRTLLLVRAYCTELVGGVY